MALTGKQEKFCQEIANGLTYSNAYREAYNAGKMTSKQINEEASKLMSTPKISQRVSDLREKLSLFAQYDREAHFKELEELRKLSLDIENGRIELHNAIKATELKGKLTGHYQKETDIEVSSGNITVKIVTGG